MSRRREWLGVALLAVVVAVGAVVAYTQTRPPPTQWIVRASLNPESGGSIESTEQACGESARIVEKNYTASSEQIPGRPGDGPYWRVEGRGTADDVADCFRQLDMTFIEVSRYEGEQRLVTTGD